jgi:hypothetical protein
MPCVLSSCSADVSCANTMCEAEGHLCLSMISLCPFNANGHVHKRMAPAVCNLHVTCPKKVCCMYGTLLTCAGGPALSAGTRGRRFCLQSTSQVQHNSVQHVRSRLLSKLKTQAIWHSICRITDNVPVKHAQVWGRVACKSPGSVAVNS